MSTVIQDNQEIVSRAELTRSVEAHTVIVGSETQLHRSDASNPLPEMLAEFAAFLRLDVANGDATEDTIAGYAREVKLFLQWCHESGIDAARATRSDIIHYRAHLRENEMKVSTRKLKLSVVRRFYDAAVKAGFLIRNPATDVRGGKDLTAPEEKIKALTAPALSTLVASIPLDTLAGKRDRAVIGLWAIHKLRRVEVHNLNHESLSLDELAPNGSGARLTFIGKGKRWRTIYLRPDTYKAICVYIEAKMQAGLPLSGALIVAHDNASRGKRISRRGLNYILDGYLESTGLKRDGFGPHGLRHTGATLSLAGGAKIEHLREEMGHADIATTSIYVRALDRKRHNPANFIDVEI